MIQANHYASEDIQNQIDDMMLRWGDLKVKADEKGLEMNAPLIYSIFLS